MGGVLARLLFRALAGATQMIKKNNAHITRGFIGRTSQAGFSRASIFEPGPLEEYTQLPDRVRESTSVVILGGHGTAAQPYK
jgi:hypothetical protein